MKNIKVDFFSESKKWPRRIPKIKTITKKTINKTVRITKIKIPTIINADRAPVRPSSKVEAKALGISIF